MKNKFLLIFCSAALLTVMNTSYASSLPSASKGTFQVGDRRIAGAGKLCNGKLVGTYANYRGRYSSDYAVDGFPTATIYFTDMVDKSADRDRGIAEVILVNGRSISSVKDHAGVGGISINTYRFQGSDRVHRIKSGDRVKAVFFYAGRKKDIIECTVPSKETGL